MTNHRLTLLAWPNTPYNSGMLSYELYARQLPWPVDWAQVYGRAAPLLMEIGFGGGHFLVDLARRRPAANILGVEIALPGIRRGVQKLKTAGVRHGRVIQSTAEHLLWLCCAPDAVSEVYINFPDPWPKAGQQHRRLINDTFLALLAARMLPGGTLHVATDDPDYAQAIASCLERSSTFASCLPAAFVTEDTARPRTKYELIALDAGRTCHYFRWQRQAVPAPRLFPIPKELPMPHVIMHLPLSPEQIANRFRPQQFSADDVHVRLPLMFQAAGGTLLLVEVYIHEESLSQRVGLLVRQREDGDYLVGLSEIGFPRPTPGVHLAIGGLARWLLGLHGDTAVKQHNLTVVDDYFYNEL